MAFVCDYCSKGKVQSRQSRHRKGVAGKQWAKRAQSTLRVFSPNLQWATIDGVKLRLCTKCLKRLRVPQVSKVPSSSAKATADRQVSQAETKETAEVATV